MTTSKRLAPERRAPGTLPLEETDSSIHEQEPITRTKLATRCECLASSTIWASGTNSTVPSNAICWCPEEFLHI